MGHRGGGVVDTPHGKCFNVTYNDYFECTNGKLFNFLDSTVDKEMIFEFIDTGYFGYHFISSGDYDKQIAAGWTFFTTNNQLEFFITNQNGNYDRLYSNSYLQPLGEINKYVIQLDATNNRIRVVDVINNSIGAWRNRFTTTETWARLFVAEGSQLNRPHLLKSFSIKEGLTTF